MQVNISAEIKHSPETGSNRSDRLIPIFVASFNLNYPQIYILYNQIKRCQERIKYHSHPRFYMTDKDNNWGIKTKGGGEKTTYTPQTYNKSRYIETKNTKKKQKAKPQQEYGGGVVLLRLSLRTVQCITYDPLEYQDL